MMEENKKDGGQLQIQAMWFAAGTAALMAFLERAILVSFMEQWRVFVFLALNLLLLAILFTSTRPISSSDQAGQESSGVELEVEGKKRSKQECTSSTLVSAADHHPEDGSERLKSLKCSSKMEKLVALEVEVKNSNSQANELSKEEFNERVEAFIAMFRQHLVSDAKGKNCRLHPSPIKGSEFLSKHRAVHTSHCGRKRF